MINLKSDFLEKAERDYESEASSDELRSRKDRIKQKVELILERLKNRLKSFATITNILNLVFIVSVSGICFQQCYVQINEYFKYSVRSQVSHSFPNSTLFLIPGVTVCNNNRLRMEKLLGLSPKLRTLLDRYAFEVEHRSTLALSDSEKIERMKAIREIVESAVNVTALISESPISKLLDLASTSMIRDVDCNNLWGQQFNCENFRIIESYQGSACYTLFYIGSVQEALANNLAFDFNTTLLGGKKKIEAFDDHQIAELLIDFDPFEQADFQHDIGGKIVIHSTGNVGSVRDLSHSIEPGKNYEIILGRRMTKRLPPPYKSMCSDYMSRNSGLFAQNKQGAVPSPSIVLDTTTCLRNCIIRKSTKKCNCWPAEIPYFPGDTLIEGAQNYRMCQWVLEETQQNHTEQLYIDCYKTFHSQCRLECRRGCWTEDYKLHVMSSPWPTRAMFLGATYEFEKRELYRLRNCCAKISLKYLDYIETRQIMFPSMTLAQLVSNIGGIVSGLVGVSAVTLYRYFTRNLLGCKVVSGKYNIPATCR